MIVYTAPRPTTGPPSQAYQQTTPPRTPPLERFMQSLRNTFPDIAEEINKPHGSATHRPSWLQEPDPGHTIENITATFNWTFPDTTGAERQHAAHQLAEKLTEHMSTPFRNMAETYRAKPQHTDEEHHYYAETIAQSHRTTNEAIEKRINILAGHFTGNRTANAAAADNLLHMEIEASSHLYTTARDLNNAIPTKMTFHQAQTHAKAIAEVLTEPLWDKMEHELDNLTRDTISQYAYQEAQRTEEHNKDFLNAVHLQWRYDQLVKNRTEEIKARLSDLKQRLLDQLTDPDNNLLVLQQAVFEAYQLNNKTDFRQAQPMDLAQAMEDSARECQGARVQMARTFASALLHPARKYLEDFLHNSDQDTHYLSNIPEQTLYHQMLRTLALDLQTTAKEQARQLASSAANGRCNQGLISTTLDARATAEHTIAHAAATGEFPELTHPELKRIFQQLDLQRTETILSRFERDTTMTLPSYYHEDHRTCPEEYTDHPILEATITNISRTLPPSDISKIFHYIEQREEAKPNSNNH